jgi:hypothetical protein
MSNKKNGEKKKEDGFMKTEEADKDRQKGELQDPRFGVVTSSKNKGCTFVGHSGLKK